MEKQDSHSQFINEKTSGRFEQLSPGGRVDLLRATSVLIACTVVNCFLKAHVHPLNLIMVYLLGVVYLGSRCKWITAVASCIISVMLFDWLFVPHIVSLVPTDSEYLFTLAAMLVVTTLVSSMSVRLRENAERANIREQGTGTLCSLSLELSSVLGEKTLAEVAIKHADSTFQCHSTVFQVADGKLEFLAGAPIEPKALEWANKVYSQHSNTNSSVREADRALFMLRSSSRNACVGAFFMKMSENRVWKKAQTDLASAFCSHLVLALDRAYSSQSLQKAKLQVESMKLRNALLSSVSHDLRTPLAAIMGAASSMLDEGQQISSTTGRELVQSIFDEAQRLSRFLKNLLDMTRLESGAIRIKREWQSMEEAVGAALYRLRGLLSPFRIRTQIPPDLPLVQCDDTLIDQVITNLLENSAKYAPAGSDIHIFARRDPEGVTVGVTNEGCSLEPGTENRIFEKFFRAHPDSTYGTGLGLTICKGIIQAHTGSIWAERSGSSSLTIYFTLPVTDQPPLLADEVEQEQKNDSIENSAEKTQEQLQSHEKQEVTKICSNDPVF